MAVRSDVMLARTQAIGEQDEQASGSSIAANVQEWP